MNDLLIRQALVFDGTGAEPQLRDVAVQGGLIVPATREPTAWR